MASRGLSYRAVRRRQTGALGAVVVATAALILVVPLAAPVAGGLLSGAFVLAYAGTMVAAVIVVARAKTIAARYVVETGQVPDVPVTRTFVRELTGLQAVYTWWLLPAVGTMVVLPLGVMAGLVGAGGGPAAWTRTIAGLLAVVIVAAFWARWLWRRRTNLADVLEELETRG